MKSRVRAMPVLAILSAAAMLAAVYCALIMAPTERTMGPVQRIFYLHMPVAIVAFMAFGVAFVASIAYLARRERRWDALALSAVEIGELFATLVLLTGMLWARAAWNTWWTWDLRLTTTLVLWLIYAGYLILRGSLEDEARRARYAAVLGVVGFVDVPIVFMAIRWWRTIHPVVIELSGIHMDGRMLVALLVALVAFSLLFVTLLTARASLEALGDEVEYLWRKVQ